MTTKIQPVDFGFFFELFKWFSIKFREMEDGMISLESFEKIKLLIVCKLLIEYLDFNLGLEEFYFAIGGIELKDELLNPISFTDQPIRYVIHIKNCFLLSDWVFHWQ